MGKTTPPASNSRASTPQEVEGGPIEQDPGLDPGPRPGFHSFAEIGNKMAQLEARMSSRSPTLVDQVAENLMRRQEPLTASAPGNLNLALKNANYH